MVMTNKEKLHWCSYLLNKHRIGYTLNEKEKSFMLDIFSNHHNWEEKKGVGIDCIKILHNNFGHRGFYLQRVDGSVIDISIGSSVSGKESKYSAKLASACRTAIRPEIVKFRDNNVTYSVTKCVISGDVLTKENTHIDHYDLTFAEMLKLWLADNPKPALVSKAEWYEFEDKDVEAEFVEFHNNNCKLRAVTKEVNIKLCGNLETTNRR